MQRRTLLTLGLVSGTALAVAGAGAAVWTPGWREGRLSQPARVLFASVARAVLEGVLPQDPAVQAVALKGHLDRLDTLIAGLQPATRAELSDLLALLCTAPGRWALAGLGPAWSEAPMADVQSALQAMRVSGSAVRRQVYQALRDLSNGAWFADAGSWELLGYPGPFRL
ncbi:hypothetical protein KAK07_24075 [Ideonella sp. 4Y16]|uniref:Twin-arginine translocation pathway signal protein n=1 Tax=Ideonella alba TaxID=2824118 RepID=A0A940YBW2_9BURK|nr:hypothetical protein [Ideonella alba]MBQ0932728.1 hypothetical protein [Ideonella alba]MBQ0946435.1 hypothetical protein [Ideonella alba]